jgi:hypothetical protein
MNYKILYVEDDVSLAGKTIPQMCPDSKEALFGAFGELGIVSALKGHYLDYECSFLGALKKLASGKNDYLLIILDRDLPRTASLEDVRAVWAGVSEEKFENSRLGDLLFEFICLEAGFRKDDVLSRVRYLTGFSLKEDEDGANRGALGMGTFFETLHYTKDEQKKLQILKGQDAEFFKWVQRVPQLHIWRNHSDVFSALVEEYKENEVSKDEHVRNLITALAHVEGVELDWKPLKRPSISLLRALGEAIEDGVKKIVAQRYEVLFKEKDQDGILSEKWNNESAVDLHKKCAVIIEKEKPEFWLDPLLAAEVAIKTYSRQQFDLNTLFLNVSVIFSPSTRLLVGKVPNDLVSKIKKLTEANRHISDLMGLVQNITSQEIHHNDRPWCDGKRLELIVYALCELLRFYNKELKGPPIDLGAFNRGKVLCLMHYLNHDSDNWVEIDVLRHFSGYLSGTVKTAKDLKELGFAVDELKKAFRI